jgi:hypothetical protein
MPLAFGATATLDHTLHLLLARLKNLESGVWSLEYGVQM